MKRWGWLFLLPLLLAAKAAPGDPESLLRQGDDAFKAERWGRAAELYDRAGVRTQEPARAAFRLATAKYRLARENLAALADAEVNYRACLHSGEFRARAQFGLGNCLLIRATTGATLDRALLRAAIDRFAACAADPGCDVGLRGDAEHNRAKAKLLLLQAPPAEQGKNDEPDGEDQKDPDDKTPPKGKDGSSATGGSPTPQPKDSSGKGGERPESKKDGQPSPGKGALIQPPDDPDKPPPPREDAARLVEMATRRILEDLSAHRRGKGRQAGAGGKDW